MKNSNELRKKGIELNFDESTGAYEVIFFDENGFSILAKTKNEKTAQNKMKKYTRHLKEGRLLKEEKSIWKY